jgi:NAD(P)-dependent dehydrogenase (short-subunit alcohol dehydrogenase family)
LDVGHNVVATARNPDFIGAALGASDRLLTAKLDVTQPDQVTAAIVATKVRFGRIDVLVNNAGYGQLGWFENISDEQIHKQFETNVFGAMHVARAVLPVMREQRSGHVFTVSSVAGFVAFPGSSIYSASKFALEGWMEGLAHELKPLGIAATLIEPGYFRTDFLDTSSVAYGAYDITDYSERAAQFKVWQDGMNHQQIGDPAKLGIVMIKLAEMNEPPVRFAAGGDAVGFALDKAKALRSEVERMLELSSSTDGAS